VPSPMQFLKEFDPRQPALLESDSTRAEQGWQLSADVNRIRRLAKLGAANYGYGCRSRPIMTTTAFPDLFVNELRPENSFITNNGERNVTDVTAKAGVAGGGGGPVSAGFFDFDNDGHLTFCSTATWNGTPTSQQRPCGGVRAVPYCPAERISHRRKSLVPESR